MDTVHSFDDSPCLLEFLIFLLLAVDLLDPLRAFCLKYFEEPHSRLGELLHRQFIIVVVRWLVHSDRPCFQWPCLLVVAESVSSVYG